MVNHGIKTACLVGGFLIASSQAFGWTGNTVPSKLNDWTKIGYFTATDLYPGDITASGSWSLDTAKAATSDLTPTSPATPDIAPAWKISANIRSVRTSRWAP